jgi:hypothetical protein
MINYLKIFESFNIQPITDKKIISFSVYGIGCDYENKRGFYKGIFVNYDLAKIIYPGWIIRVYMPYDEPKEYIEKLIKITDIEVVLVDTNICLRAIRYLPNDDPSVHVWISRDLDSIVDYREKAAVDDWLINYQDKELHIMADNQQHYWTIAGGMFGFKNKNNHNNYNNLTEFMLNFSVNDQNNYSVDCVIAEQFFYKNDNYIQHYSSGKKLKESIEFPKHKSTIYCRFVGEILDINSQYDLLNIEKKYFIKKRYINNYIIKDYDTFSYNPWNSECMLEWYNETDFLLIPNKTSKSTCGKNCYLKTKNGDGKKMMDIGTYVKVLWDGHKYIEAFLDIDYNIVVIHNNKEYKFIKNK